MKIQSALLTKFWGQPIYIGTTVLLPKDYDRHPDQHYSTVYHQFHFSLSAPFGYTGNVTQPGFSRDWNADDFPRAIVVTFQHPTVYYDDSYAANSANSGPYGDAITKELIPCLEGQFRMIPEARARTLTGGSTGGWEALALQVDYPDVFGGAWVFCPDSIDFSRYLTLDIYNDDNAFVRPGVKPIPGRCPCQQRAPHAAQPRRANHAHAPGTKPDGRCPGVEEPLRRATRRLGFRLWSGWRRRLPEASLGSQTGKIDKDVAHYMQDHGYDLARYIESHWTELGPKLTGKMHFYVGDMDNWFANLAVYRMETLLTKLNAHATFTYGPRQGHMWYPMSNSELVRSMAETMNGAQDANERNHRRLRFGDK